MDEFKLVEELVKNPALFMLIVVIALAAVVVLALYFLVRRENESRRLALEREKNYERINQDNVDELRKLRKDREADQKVVLQIQAQYNEVKEALERQIEGRKADAADHAQIINTLRQDYDGKILRLKEGYDRQIASLQAELKLTRDELVAVKGEFKEAVKERDNAREKVAELRGQLSAYKANYNLLIEKLRAPEVNGDSKETLTPRPPLPLKSVGEGE